MKKICLSSVILLVLLFLGCPQPEETIATNRKPLSSQMTLTFADVSLSSEKNQYEYTINVDETDRVSGYIMVNAFHVYDEQDGQSSEPDPGFVFVCEDLNLLYPTKNGCMIDYVAIKDLGTYTIYAKSKVSSEYDRYFAINLISNLKSISVSYKMQSSYINENLEYEDQMLEGTITPITKEISLCAGAVYDFTVNDKSGNDYTIRNINVTSSSPYVFMRQIIGASGELCCRQVDGQSGNVEFCVGKTDIKLNVKINLVNNSTSSLDQITLEDVKADEVLSFVANPVSELSKHYDYQVNIQSTGYSNVDLMFCTDFYNWTEEAENAFLDNDYYTISTNPNPSWLTRSVLSYVFSDDLKYNIEVDGVLKTISITPLSDTVFNSQNHGIRNLHTYIYVRYATDSANTYRWRWRIMIGGELEGIDMYTHSSAGDKTIDNNLIEIHEGDEVSWIFRCMYRPSVTSNHRTLWYLSESDEMKNYILDNGAHVTLPVPAQLNSAANKALYFFGGKNEKRSFGDLTGGLTVYYYLLDEETENGISDLWTNYGTSGSDCKLVVVNLDNMK